jgi:hypothetical protein
MDKPPLPVGRLNFGPTARVDHEALPPGVKWSNAQRCFLDAEGYEVTLVDDFKTMSYIPYRVSGVPRVVPLPEPLKPMTFDFQIALRELNGGERVQRAGWNGKGMYVFLIAEWTYTNGKNDNMPCLPFYALKTADGSVVPWLASQTAMLAEDWSHA